MNKATGKSLLRNMAAKISNPAHYLAKEQLSEAKKVSLLCYLWPRQKATREKADTARKASLWVGTVGINYSPNQKKQEKEKKKGLCQMCS